MRRLARCFGFFATLAAAAGAYCAFAGDEAARAQISRTIRIVVPYAPGGTADIVARLMADEAGRVGGPTMVVENRPGARGAVGTETVARHAGRHDAVRGLDAVSDRSAVEQAQLRPVAQLRADLQPGQRADGHCRQRRLALSHACRTARRRAGEAGADHNGEHRSASSFQLGFEMLKRAAKADMTFVPYPGDAPALNAVLGQRVTSMFRNAVERLGIFESRTITRARGWQSQAGAAAAGRADRDRVRLAGFDIDAWFGAFAPAATPGPAFNEVEHLVTSALAESAVKEELSVQGLFPTLSCGNDFAAYLRKQNDAYSRIIAEANIKAE